MPQPKKIVVTGPESTGKSTLCEQLAKKYNTTWVPEYAREYLLKLGRPYTYDDLLIIARGTTRAGRPHHGFLKITDGIYRHGYVCNESMV